MVEGGAGPSFPVVFYDGEREISVGDVIINPTLEYKPFQLLLSQKIGISPNQISIYLVDRKRTPEFPFLDERRRIPITGKVNFASICRQKDCYFLAVLKRSRKSRNRREKAVNGVEFADLSEIELSSSPMHQAPENLVLLRRNQAVPFYDHFDLLELAKLNYRLQMRRIEMEMATANNMSSPNLLSRRGLNPQSFSNLSMDSTPMIDDSYRYSPETAVTESSGRKKTVFCEDCVNEKQRGDPTSFHPCVNDSIIPRFRTRFGPISKPVILFR